MLETADIIEEAQRNLDTAMLAMKGEDLVNSVRFFNIAKALCDLYLIKGGCEGSHFHFEGNRIIFED